MSRFSKILLAASGILMIAVTWRQEHTYRYHYDTLRQEGRWTTSLLGITMWSSEDKSSDDPKSHDLYSTIYQQITGKTPSPQRWHHMPPDRIRSLRGRLDITFGLFRPTADRIELLTAVYEKYRAGGTREDSAANIARIDVLLPMPWIVEQKFDWAPVHALKREFGIKSYLHP